MILRKSVPGPPMGIYDGHIVRFSGGFCQTFFALRTTVKQLKLNKNFPQSLFSLIFFIHNYFDKN